MPLLRGNDRCGRPVLRVGCRIGVVLRRRRELHGPVIVRLALFIIGIFLVLWVLILLSFTGHLPPFHHA